MTPAEQTGAGNGRIRSCMQATAGWFGTVQMQRTGRHWGGEFHRLARRRKVAMGWTPQLLSVRGIAEMEAVLLAASLALPAAK